MLIKEHKQLDIQTIGNTGTLDAGINQASFGFLFEMLSKSLYSNPIGSIIREITSNCFDSHKEAKIDLPVMIKKTYDYDEESDFISFIDYGVGLSPYRIKTIYMNWFSSTKRETNDLIGGFGLGSKSPLSYQDLFYINTVSNEVTLLDNDAKVPYCNKLRTIKLRENTEYQYVFHKGESKPQLDLLSKQITTKHKGTEIKLAIKSGDTYKFQSEIGKQLCYFDNVYVEGFGVNNIYKIYEGKYFKYRNVNQYNDEFHIILGKVSYPIDWEQIGMKPIEIEVGVKFEVGEIDVTPSRESLRYTEETKAIVKERIEKALEEIKSLFDNSQVDIDDIFEYLEKRKTKPHIKFGETDKLYIPVKYGTRNAYKYTPLKDYDITIPDNPFFEFISKSYIDSSKGEITYKSSEVFNLLKSVNPFVISKDLHSNKLKNLYIGDMPIIEFKKTTFREMCLLLDFTTSGNNNRAFNKQFNFTRNASTSKPPVLGRAKAIYEFRKAMKKEVSNRKLYNYDKLVVPIEWIEERKRRELENSLAYKRKLAQTFPVRDIILDCTYDWSGKNIERFNGIIIYGTIENKDELKLIADFIENRIYLHNKDYYGKRFLGFGGGLNGKAIRVFRVSKQNAKQFNKQNHYTVKEFMDNNEMFRKLVTAIKLRGFPSFPTYQEGLEQFLPVINKDIAAKFNTLKTLINDNSWGIARLEANFDYREVDRRKRIYQVLLDYAEEHNLFDESLMKIHAEIEEYFKDVEILKHIKITKEAVPSIISYLRKNGKRVNSEHYISYPAIIKYLNPKVETIIVDTSYIEEDLVLYPQLPVADYSSFYQQTSLN
jgi:hypothetical protein